MKPANRNRLGKRNDSEFARKLNRNTPPDIQNFKMTLRTVCE